MPCPLLPFELLVSVLEMAFDDKESVTLQNCALVCQAWRDVARPYIFRKIKITDESLLVAFEALINADSTVGMLVRKLIIQPRTQERTPSSWISGFSAVLPSHLTRLQTIQLVDLYDFGEYCDEGFFLAFSGFASVDRLILCHCSLDLHLIYSCASALAGLHHLHIGPTSPLPSLLSDPPPQLHSPHLVSITLDLGVMYPMALQEVLEWIMASPSKETLRSFRVTTRIAEAATVGNFIRELGEIIQDLDLHLEQSFDLQFEYDLIKADISLSYCTALRSLFVHDSNPTLPAFIALLSEVSSQHICSLSLQVLSEAKDPADLPDFGLLAAQLDSHHLSSLKEVCFVYQGPLQRAVVLEKLRQDLPNTDTRGILRLIMA